MAFSYDILVVGSGWAGATVARKLADEGLRVLVLERRNHIGGNCYDEYNEHGILIHRYGPHIFHTKFPHVWEFASRFTSWRLYRHEVRSYVDGTFFPIPVNLNTMEMLYHRNFTREEMISFISERVIHYEEPKNSHEVIVSQMGQDIYDKFFAGYTLKQWGVTADELEPEVCSRIPIRYTRDNRYFSDPYQGIPKEGYGRLFRRMLDHDRISLLLKTDYSAVKDEIKAGWTVYTGGIDTFFDRVYGPLPYRGIRFVFETHEQENYQGWGVVNYPNDFKYTRITEYKKLTGQERSHTTLSFEYPSNNGEPCYPMPTKSALALYGRYRKLADKMDRTSFLGRLGSYRYINMDQAILQGLDLAEELLELI